MNKTKQSSLALTEFTEHKKKGTATYDNGNPDSGLGQAQKRGRVKPVNGIASLTF